MPAVTVCRRLKDKHAGQGLRLESQTTLTPHYQNYLYPGNHPKSCHHNPRKADQIQSAVLEEILQEPESNEQKDENARKKH